MDRFKFSCKRQCPRQMHILLSADNNDSTSSQMTPTPSHILSHTSTHHSLPYLCSQYSSESPINMGIVRSFNLLQIVGKDDLATTAPLDQKLTVKKRIFRTHAPLLIRDFSSMVRLQLLRPQLPLSTMAKRFLRSARQLSSALSSAYSGLLRIILSPRVWHIQVSPAPRS